MQTTTDINGVGRNHRYDTEEVEPRCTIVISTILYHKVAQCCNLYISVNEEVVLYSSVGHVGLYKSEKAKPAAQNMSPRW